MLVLTTMFINVSNNLPKTSYMKMMDVWLLFNLLYPFIIVLLHTYMDTLRNNDGKDEKDDILKVDFTNIIDSQKINIMFRLKLPLLHLFLFMRKK